MRKLIGRTFFFLAAWLVLTGLSLLIGLELFSALGFRGPLALAVLLGAPLVTAIALTVRLWHTKLSATAPRVGKRSSDDDWPRQERTPVYTGLKDSSGNDVYM